MIVFTLSFDSPLNGERAADVLREEGYEVETQDSSVTVRDRESATAFTSSRRDILRNLPRARGVSAANQFALERESDSVANVDWRQAQQVSSNAVVLN